MVTKLILLVLCISAAYGAGKNACGRTGLWGKRATPMTSEKSELPPLIRHFTLSIPDGQTVCNANRYMYFVGEEVVCCDYDVAPSVKFDDSNYIINPSVVYVSRNGKLLENATTYTIYYCQ